MKIRRLILSALVGISLFASSQAAFAQVGLGDTRINAVSVKKDPIYNGWVSRAIITKSDDYDWYKWTNTDTKLRAFITAALYMPYTDYMLNAPWNQSDPDNGQFTGNVRYDRYKTTAYLNIVAEPGQTVYWRVSRGERPGETRNYFTYVRLNSKF